MIDEAEGREFGGTGADLEEEVVVFDGVPLAVVVGAAFVAEESDGVPRFELADLMGDVEAGVIADAEAADGVGNRDGGGPGDGVGEREKRAAGRRPMVSILSSRGALESGQRAFSASRAAEKAARSRSSRVASSLADSERISTSMETERGMELTLVPPSTVPMLKVVLGVLGTWRSAMRAMARPMAWAGLGMPKAP